MPFSPDNPHRDRNILVAALLGIFLFALLVAGYIYVDSAGRDTEAYGRFLGLLTTTIAIGALNTWRQFRTERAVKDNGAKVEQVVKTLNGGHDGQPGMDERMRNAARTANAEQTKEGGPSDGHR